MSGGGGLAWWPGGRPGPSWPGGLAGRRGCLPRLWLRWAVLGLGLGWAGAAAGCLLPLAC